MEGIRFTYGLSFLCLVICCILQRLYKIDYVSGSGKMELLKTDDLSGKEPGGGAVIEVFGPKSLDLESRGSSMNRDSVEVDEQQRDPPNHDPLHQHQLEQPVTFTLFILRNHNSHSNLLILGIGLNNSQ